MRFPHTTPLRQELTDRHLVRYTWIPGESNWAIVLEPTEERSYETRDHTKDSEQHPACARQPVLVRVAHAAGAFLPSPSATGRHGHDAFTPGPPRAGGAVLSSDLRRARAGGQDRGVQRTGLDTPERHNVPDA